MDTEITMEVIETEPTINDLPDELILYIMKYLPAKAIIACTEVSQRWKGLALEKTVLQDIRVVYCNRKDVAQENLEVFKLVQAHGVNIRHLQIQYVYNLTILTEMLEACTNLTSLELIMCMVNGKLENFLKGWPDLRRLRLKCCVYTPKERPRQLLIPFECFGKLTYICLSDFCLLKNNSSLLLNLPYLTHIYIDKCNNLELRFIKQLITTQSKILEALHIHGGNAVDDQCLHYLSLCPKLKDLAIIRCEPLTDEGLSHLPKLQHMEEMQIWNNRSFTEACLMKTFLSPSLVKLKSLSFSRIDNIKPALIDGIAEKYKNLRFFSVYHCSHIMDTEYEKTLLYKFRNTEIVVT